MDHNIDKELLLEMFLMPDSKLKKESVVILGLWSRPLNIDYYSKYYYPDLIYDSSESEGISASDGHSYKSLKDKITKDQLRAIDRELLDLKNIFKRYSFPTDLRKIRRFLSSGKLEPENETFLRILKEEDLNLEEIGRLAKNRLEEIGKMDLMYILSIAYIDLYKIHQFLSSKLAKAITDNPVQKKAVEKKENDGPSATQWALYHYILQVAKVKPWFIPGKKKKEFIELGEIYGRSWSNLQGRYNAINNSQGKLGYQIGDTKVVKEIISEKHPEVIPHFEEVTSKLI